MMTEPAQQNREETPVVNRRKGMFREVSQLKVRVYEKLIDPCTSSLDSLYLFLKPLPEGSYFPGKPVHPTARTGIHDNPIK